jgi:hypothetical protein
MTAIMTACNQYDTSLECRQPCVRGVRAADAPLLNVPGGVLSRRGFAVRTLRRAHLRLASLARQR